MAAFSLSGLVNIIMVMTGAMTVYRIVILFNVTTMLLEFLHWLFSW